MPTSLSFHHLMCWRSFTFRMQTKWNCSIPVDIYARPILIQLAVLLKASIFICCFHLSPAMQSCKKLKICCSGSPCSRHSATVYPISFRDIRTLPDHRVQAIHTQSVGSSLNPTRKRFSFRDSYMDIICYNTIERLGENASLPYALRQLAAFDKREQSDFLTTLSCYFDHLCNLSETASALAVHPNTIRLRLNKITELIGLDVRDFEVARQLYTGLNMMRVLQHYHVPEQNQNGE